MIGVKIAGMLLLLFDAYLLSVWLTKKDEMELLLLEEGEYLFRMLESEIRNAKVVLPELFLEMSGRTSSVWHDFFMKCHKS